MRRALCALALAAGLSACSSDSEPPPAAIPASSPAPAPVSTLAPDACGAAGLQVLVGRPRSEIPVPLLPDLQRVACTTCPVTEDYNSRRLNFFFDARTGAIRKVSCG